MMEDLLKETNRYAALLIANDPNTLKKWNPVTLQELWTFLGLQLLMIQKPKLKDYRSTDELITTLGFQKHMARDRYERICGHYTFATTKIRTGVTGYGSLASFFLGSQLASKIASASVKTCASTSLLQFKRRLSFRHYMPLKRAKFGIKYYVLVDFSTGFVADLKVYLGKGTGLDIRLSKELGLGGGTVASLLEDHFGKGP